MSRKTLLLGLVVVLAIGLGHAWMYKMPFEDSYITFRYARNLVEGLGVSYNPGERVEGCTSVGWVFLLAGFARAGFSLPWTGVFLSLFFGLGTLVVTQLLAQRCLPRLGRWALGAPLLVAVSGTFAYYAASGMETTLFSLLVSASLLVAALGERRNAFVAGLLLGLSSVVRPEAAGYALVFALALWARGEDTRAEAASLLGAFALVFIPVLAWRHSYFGYWLPNTFYAKARVGAAGVVTGIEQVEEFFTLDLFWLAVLGLYLLWPKERASRFWWLALAVVVGANANVILVGGDSFCFYRFCLPAMPAGAVLSMGALQELYERYREKISREKAMVIFAGIVLFVFGASWLPRVTLLSERNGTNRGIILGVDTVNTDYFFVGRWLRESFPKSTLLATNAAGIVPYESGFRTIDMLGLNDAHIAHHPVSGSGSLGHQKHDPAYVVSRHPDLILPGLPLLVGGKLAPEEILSWIRSWVGSMPGEAELFERAIKSGEYLLVTVPVEERGWLTLYVRKGAPMPPGMSAPE